MQSITVADYSWQFFERVKQRKYGQTEEENSEVAGQNFYGAYQALSQGGSEQCQLRSLLSSAYLSRRLRKGRHWGISPARRHVDRCLICCDLCCCTDRGLESAIGQVSTVFSNICLLANWPSVSNFCAVLITKLQETGSKDDVKVPLRVLRDEIGRVYFKRCGASPSWGCSHRAATGHLKSGPTSS